jgi:hypothetical protein
MKTVASSPAKSSSSSITSPRRTKDIQCHACKGFGHVMKECSNKRVLIIREDGEYDSASDFDEETYALLVGGMTPGRVKRLERYQVYG